MAATSFPSQIRSTYVTYFQKECASAINTLVPRTEEKTQIALSTYEQVQTLFRIHTLTLEDQKQALIAAHFDNTEQLFFNPDFLQATELEEAYEKANQLFTDRFVTHYPDIGIDYGRLCVGSRQKWDAPDLKKHDKMAPFRIKYPSFRAVRGDGNCFYTGFTIALLEHVVKTGQTLPLLTRIVERDEWDSPGRQNVLELLAELTSNPEVLEERLQTNQHILCVDNLLRSIAAAEMRAHPGNYGPFLDKTLEEYIKENVLPMGENADHHAILALCRAFEFPILIHDVGVDTHLNGTHMGDEALPPIAALCRDGEHYFFFYSEASPRTISATVPSPISLSFPSSSRSLNSSISASKTSGSSKSVAPFRATVRFNPGSGNTLEIWGKGPGMDSWKKGVPLRKSGADSWIWESSSAFEPFEYKIVIKKKGGSVQWESGMNHKMIAGKSVEIKPHF